MNHVWFYEKWKDLNLSNVKESIIEFSHSCKRLGDITVGDLCCLAKSPHSPVGIYVFIDDEKILYTGKTHGRSFHERMLSHLDHRKPIEGSPHLAQLVQSILKSGDFREDSGIYFSNGEFTGLLSVDANMINFDRLPKVNFYGSSFAGGASGYPLMFDNYKVEEQIKISLNDKNFL